MDLRLMYYKNCGNEVDYRSKTNNSKSFNKFTNTLMSYNLLIKVLSPIIKAAKTNSYKQLKKI